VLGWEKEIENSLTVDEKEIIKEKMTCNVRKF